MKKLCCCLTLLLALTLLVPLGAMAEDVEDAEGAILQDLLVTPDAMAEELPSFEQLSQDVYINVSLLTPDSYPMIRIMPYYFSTAFVSQSKEPYFMCFPCPAGTYAANFDEYSVTFLDFEYYRQYIYVAQDGYAYENFLNKCDVDEYILADGSDGLAIYIEPDRERAHALIGVPEISKSAKLEVTIIDGSLSRRGEETTIASLTEQIQAEVARIQANLVVELAENYWTAGQYAGFKVLSHTANAGGAALTYTMPEDYAVIRIDNASVTMYQVRGQRNSLSVKFNVSDYSYVSYKQEEEPDSVTTVTIGDAEYRIYANWYNDEKIMSVYVDRVISTTAGYNSDKPLYLTLDLDPEGEFEWTSMDALVAELTTIVAGVQIDFEQELRDYREVAPYAAAE